MRTSQGGRVLTRDQAVQGLRRFLLLAGGLLYMLHFRHLAADFPNDSPWMDWSKYTDEGWYTDAATRHFLLGHWYLPGDFNPAVALPFWPLLVAAVFRFSGVSLVAARALAVGTFGVLLLAAYALVTKFAEHEGRSGRRSLAGALTVFFLAASPFFYVFERMAILEPSMAALAVLALWNAACLESRDERNQQGWRKRWRAAWPQVSLGLLLAALLLTKTTSLAIFPAIAYMMWARAGKRLVPALRLMAVPFMGAALLWGGYTLVLVRPRFWEDYQYLYAANAYTGFQLQPLATVLANTFADGRWMGGVLYPFFFVAMLLLLFGRPRSFSNPLMPSLLLWFGGYFCFLAYHNNLQPRYYLVLAVPVTMLFSLALDEGVFFVTAVRGRALRSAGYIAIALVAVAVAIPDLLLEASFVLHPEFTYAEAAQGIARLVRADRKQSPWVLSVSGSDLTLMTGLPSIDDDFGTLDLEERVAKYKPGWYVAWNEIDDDKMDALAPLYKPVRVASFAALDDPDRDQLILYRLDPAEARRGRRKRRVALPRPLRTKLGQQPTSSQLQH